MLRLLGVALVAVALLAPSPAGAQTEPAFAELALAPPDGADGSVAVAPRQSPWTVAWTLTFPTPASAAAASTGDTTIEWALECSANLITLEAAPTSVDVQPGQMAYSGSASLNLSASPETPGLKDQQCTLRGTATIPGQPQPSVGAVEFQPHAEFVGTIRIEASMPSRKAGPDKQIPFPVTVENLGNARVQVDFHVDYPTGKWDVLVPDPLVLDSPHAGAGGKFSDTVYVTVATSYHNGPNWDARDFVVVVSVQSADVPSKLGPATNVTLHADVEGWFIPGPSSALVMLGLAVAAFVTRRR